MVGIKHQLSHPKYSMYMKMIESQSRFGKCGYERKYFYPVWDRTQFMTVVTSLTGISNTVHDSRHVTDWYIEHSS
jgi:hypothetical protein